MTDGRSVGRVARVAVLLATPAVLGATGLTTNFDDRVLAAHNRGRAELGIAPLRWDPALAASAQRWANRLAVTGNFKHAPEQLGKPEGENLWAGSKNRYSIEAMVGSWLLQKRFFKPGKFPNNSTTGNGRDIQHYTQMMWRATRKVGCARAVEMRDEIMVCRYTEAGNYIGEQPF